MVTGSLPLMGIGNYERGVIEERNLLKRSLPLMGIGNLETHRSADAHGGRPLITPHGDWKPASGSTGGASGSTAHYPSWGLETLLDSLPVLGGAFLAHYPSWGLETDRRRGSHAPSRTLITPHGDWKL